MKNDAKEISEVKMLTESQRVDAVKIKIKTLLGKELTEAEKYLLSIYNKQRAIVATNSQIDLVNQFKEKLKKIKDK
jgi:hypothetical protein